MTSKYIYFSKDELKKGMQFVTDITDEPIEYDRLQKVEIVCDFMPQLVLYDESTDSGRIASLKETIDHGCLVLDNSEYYDPITDRIELKYNVPCSPTIKNRVWSDETRSWVEGGSKDDFLEITKQNLYLLMNKYVVLEKALNTLTDPLVLELVRLDIEIVKDDINNIETELSKLLKQ